MQHSIVKKLFHEQARYYAKESQEAAGSPLVSIFLDWSKDRRKKLKVCEFGGAGGILLDCISKKTDLPIDFYNLEIVQDYRKYQVNSKIKFFVESILNSHFSDNFFDCVIIRDILHHLVGRNFTENLKNQKRALREIKRLTKPGGLILIEELLVQYLWAARIIYWLSKLNTKIGLRWRFFEISPYTVVSFLTNAQLEEMIKDIFKSQNIIKKISILTDKQWQARVTHLGFRTKKLILVIKT